MSGLIQTSPENHEMLIAVIEKRLSDPRQNFLAFFPIGLGVSILFGLLVTILLGGGWQKAVAVALPFCLVSLICLPVTARYVYTKELPDLKDGRKTNWAEFVKPSAQLSKVFACFIISMALGMLLELGLIHMFGINNHGVKCVQNSSVISPPIKFARSTGKSQKK